MQNDTVDDIENKFGFVCLDCKELIYDLNKDDSNITENLVFHITLRKLPDYFSEYDKEYVYQFIIKDFYDKEINRGVFIDLDTYTDCFDYIIKNVKTFIPILKQDYINTSEILQ